MSLEVPNSARVLVVDDNSQILSVVQEILRLHGFVTQTASSAVEALQLLGQNTPDLIVCDVMMPQMDGFAFHEELQKNDSWCNIPFVFLTALNSSSEIRYAKERGCDDYLTKPFEPLDLLAAVRGKLSLAKVRKNSHESQLERYRRNVIQTLSHEFRTPLVAISTGTELLLDQLGFMKPDSMRRLIESIQRGGQRLQRLVEDFMALQQIESGIAQSSHQRYHSPIRTSYLVESALEEFLCNLSQENEKERFTLICDSSARLDIYNAQIVNALSRILSNAVKFSDPGTQISLHVRDEASCAVIEVRDHGPGLSDEMLREACITFAQIDRDAQEQQGCGLGLPIANYLIELNGGTLSFHRPDQGAGLLVKLKFPTCDK